MRLLGTRLAALCNILTTLLSAMCNVLGTLQAAMCNVLRTLLAAVCNVPGDSILIAFCTEAHHCLIVSLRECTWD